MKTSPEHAASPSAEIGGTAQGLTLTAITFLPITVAAGLSPALPAMVAHFHYVPGAVMLLPLVITMPSLAVAFLGPLAGRATEVYGRRKLLLGAICVCIISGFAPFFLSNLYAILATRLLLGVAESVVLTINNALYSDYFSRDRRRYWLSIYGLVGPFFAAGAIAASGFLTAWRWNGAFLLYPTVIAVIGLAAYLYCFEPTKDKNAQATATAKDRQSRPFPMGKVVVMCIIAAITVSIFHLFVVQGAFAFRAIGVVAPADIGLYMALSTLSTPIGALMFFYCSKHLRGEWLIALLVAIVAASLVGMGLSRDLNTMFAFAVLEHIGAGMTVPSLIYWSSTLLDAEHRARGLGFFTSAIFIGQFMVPLNFALAKGISGDVLGAFVMIGAAGLVFAAILLFVRLIPSKETSFAPAPAVAR